MENAVEPSLLGWAEESRSFRPFRGFGLLMPRQKYLRALRMAETTSPQPFAIVNGREGDKGGSAIVVGHASSMGSGFVGRREGRFAPGGIGARLWLWELGSGGWEGSGAGFVRFRIHWPIDGRSGGWRNTVGVGEWRGGLCRVRNGSGPDTTFALAPK